MARDGDATATRQSAGGRGGSKTAVVAGIVAPLERLGATGHKIGRSALSDQYGFNSRLHAHVAGARPERRLTPNGSNDPRRDCGARYSNNGRGYTPNAQDAAQPRATFRLSAGGQILSLIGQTSDR